MARVCDPKAMGSCKVMSIMFFKTITTWLKNKRLPKFFASDIELLAYDFDGVMTDNRVVVSQDGTESVTVNRSDGFGVDRFRALGIRQLIVSTETNPVVQARARKLKIEVIDSCSDKKSALQEYCKTNGYDIHRTVFVGNDLNDLEVMKSVGIPVAPSDAHSSVLSIAKLITSAGGGCGVIKELSEIIKAE